MRREIDDQECDASNYRCPMPVTAVRCYPGCPKRFSYPICPRCRQSLEREYQSFCDRCGQKLDWSRLPKAVVVLA